MCCLQKHTQEQAYVYADLIPETDVCWSIPEDDSNALDVTTVAAPQEVPPSHSECAGEHRSERPACPTSASGPLVGLFVLQGKVFKRFAFQSVLLLRLRALACRSYCSGLGNASDKGPAVSCHSSSLSLSFGSMLSGVHTPVQRPGF